jgi:gluconate 2-dehydrogenase gamma chain
MTGPDKSGVGRRRFLKSVGVAGAASAMAPLGAGLAEAQSPPAPAAHDMAMPGMASAPAGHAYRFFNDIEAKFIEAAVDTVIPHDAVGPGALEVGVAQFLDNQLSGAYGQGARLYLSGPFAEGTPTQGYQLPLTPAELYRVAIADVNDYCARTYKKRFDQLDAETRKTVLEGVEGRKIALANVPGATFFGMFLGNVMEGYFGDPMYGGNKNKAVWKMIGFPGASAMYADVIAEYRNKPYPVDPKGIEDLS